MSQIRSNNSQRYSNSNVSGGFGRSGTSQAGAGRSGSGFVSLGGLPKRGRSGPGSSAAKLSIPKPVNLPSLRKENAGNDPLSQIVHGGGGGWQKPEPEQAPPPQNERPSSLVGNSNWASRQQEQAASLSQQPLAVESAYLGYGARDRRLNPAEYPSLSAAAYAAQQQQTKQQQQQAVSSSQATGQWDEDERHGPVAPHSRLQDPPEWDGLAANDQDLQYGRSDQQPQPAYDRSYRYTEGSYRPPGSSEYSMPGRGQDRYVDPRAGDYGSRRDFDQGAAYSRDSRGSQYSQQGSDTQYTPRFGSRGPPPRGPSGEASACTYEDPRWSRGVDGPSARGNRSPSHAERPPSYAERPPSYAGRPPSYADRPRAPLAERPTRYEEPAYRPVPVVEYIPIIDEALFPPPPPSSMGGRGGNLTGPADGGTPKDLEREAFNAELDRLAADLDKERQRKREAPPQPPVEEESGLSEDAAAAENTAAMAVAAGEVAAATAQAHAALPGSEELKTAEAAVAKAKMKFKPLVDEEDERRRASAAAKLRALDEAIAKRKAEEDRKHAEAEAAAAAIAEAEAALLAEQLAKAEAAEAAAQAAAAADAADEEEQEPLLAQESVPEAAGSPATADLLGMDESVSKTEFNAVGGTVPSAEMQVTSSVAAAAKLLESFSDELEELLPEPPSAVPTETPKPPVNAWAKPLTLPNGQTPSPWQAATAPTPAEAAHQASAQALGLTLTSAQGRRPQPSQDTQTDAPGDVTPASWEEPVLQATQPKAQSWQARQQGPPQRSDQPGWRRLPQPSNSGAFAGDGSVGPGDGLGMADRGRGRGRGCGRGRARESPAGSEGQPFQQVPEGDARFRSDRSERGRQGGRNARGRGARGGRQREFAKEERDRFAVAKSAAGTDALGANGPAAPVQLDAWAHPTSAPPPPHSSQAADQSHKRQQQPRVREQAAKRGRSRGPSSRPGSAASKAKQEGEELAASTAVAPATANEAAPVSPEVAAAAPSAPPLPSAQVAAVKAAEATNTDFNWVHDNTAAQVVSSIAQLNLDMPVSLSPVLDPVARHPGAADASLPDVRGFQIERPGSAKVTAVTRPKSANTPRAPFSASNNAGLPNAMPALPADLTFDPVLDKSSLGGPGAQGPNINFGRMQQPQPNQAMARLHPGAFPAALFPTAHQNNSRGAAMWQPPPPPPPQEPSQSSQPNLAAAVESFYAAKAVNNSTGFGNTAATAFSGAPTTAPPSNPHLNLPQFGSFGAGSFGSGLQFGQLGGAFGQSPFIPTGKQPDWSTGPIPGNSNPPPQPPAHFASRAPEGLPSGLRNFNARNHAGMPNGAPVGAGPHPSGPPRTGPAGIMQPPTPAGSVVPFDAAAGLPDDVFDEPKQKPLDNQQQRMANGSYRGRGDPRRGRGRNDGPPGRSYRGSRSGRGPQGMPYGAPLMDAPSNLMAANQRNNDFPRDAARPQRMATDGTAQGQGRGAPFGRGHARGGGAHRGRGGRTGSTAQKVAAPKAGGEEASSGPTAG
ncbi:hypothetical protein WJX77_012324 [Trebouxia sp. C0004]